MASPEDQLSLHNEAGWRHDQRQNKQVADIVDSYLPYMLLHPEWPHIQEMRMRVCAQAIGQEAMRLVLEVPEPLKLVA